MREGYLPEYTRMGYQGLMMVYYIIWLRSVNHSVLGLAVAIAIQDQTSPRRIGGIGPPFQAWLEVFLYITVT